MDREILKNLCQRLGINFCVPTRVDFSYQTSLDKCGQHCPALHAETIHQELTCDASTAGTCKFVEDTLRNLEFFKYIHFSCDVFSILSNLSQPLQQSLLTVEEIQKTLDDGFHLRACNKLTEDEDKTAERGSFAVL
ncbi:hypothetical protein PR048_020073 [Dryococelus australis]|uniref:Uncharacterized protein n=1 Tax=Dryococelus australis TaxID=614101 RepID=A0ABQ9H598_9NEOP|nr:hypothetical protein PR048_020073 [Dryococelus australis]